MTDTEKNLRSVLFLVIGILLLLSLIICIFIVAGESDLVETKAPITKVVDSEIKKGSKDVTVSYTIENGTNVEYSYITTDEVEVDDEITIYYHSKNPSTVQMFKTSKLIFICPLIGLVICIIGLIELFKNGSQNHRDDYQTSVIGVVGDTRQLKIITDDVVAQPYEKTPEEIAEAQVKTIKKSLENIKPVEPIVIPKSEPVQPVQQSVPQQSPQPVVQQPVIQQPVQSVPQPVQQVAPVQPVQNEQVIQPKMEIPAVPVQRELSVPKAAVVQKAPEPQPVQQVAQQVPVQPTVNQMPQPVQQPTMQVPEQAKDNNSQREIVSKIQEAAKSNPGLGEDEIKNMIKDVLKEVISEVKVDKEPPKPVVQKRVLPNYFYISGTSLIYEESGKEAKEISLKTIKSVVRTINSEGNVVKLVVSNDEIKCILTNMKNIDLEQVANLLHNKMSTIDENFNEVIEHKEY